MDYFRVLYALSEMYVALFLYDLNDNSYEAIKSNRFIDMWSSEHEGPREKTINVVKNITASDDLDKMVRFADIYTVSERMQNIDIISETFEGKINGLCRASFIVVDRNPDMSVHHALYAVEVIQERDK